MRAFQDYDVVVAGAGTAGACAAWHFAKAGKRVLLFRRRADRRRRRALDQRHSAMDV
ncbi:MAG: FAD-dependent oxidoreductase [Deltaproteobacteria bacterium]|nr:FAD-dependent oxidoreductase [Deltaproteobacteria bacterium]